MSIINEALKKASQTQEVFRPTPAVTGRAPRSSPINWGPIFVLLVLVLITAPIVAPLFSRPYHVEKVSQTFSATSAPRQISIQQDIPVNVTAMPSFSKARPQFGIEESPLVAGRSPVQIQRPYMALTGIMFSPDRSWCIINDKVVTVGDKIQGAKLTRITPEKVTLDYQGEPVILYSPS
ncbi:MAG: general secretion pathway protein GspB [Candidatus Omnitrophica bacterium]|nr:general secretion pathway protein GspB [Candidatus Omnitrophota bacterium]